MLVLTVQLRVPQLVTLAAEMAVQVMTALVLGRRRQQHLVMERVGGVAFQVRLGLLIAALAVVAAQTLLAA